MAEGEVPLDLSAWTYETVEHVVRTYEYEPGRFDYKEVLTPSMAKPEALRSLRVAACGMANADGGFILFGVADRKVPVSNPLDRICGLDIGVDSAKEFADKVQIIEPTVHFNATPAPIPLPHDGRRGIFVVHIPRSPLRPHMFDNRFYRRTPGGTGEPMGVYEVREQMVSTEERLRKVLLLRLEMATCVGTIPGLRQALQLGASTAARFDLSAFKPLLADVCVLLPQDAILLARLLHIPVLAAMLNNQIVNIPPLDARSLPQQGGLAAAIEGNLVRLERLCATCEAIFAEIFGDLGVSTDLGLQWALATAPGSSDEDSGAHMPQPATDAT